MSKIKLTTDIERYYELANAVSKYKTAVVAKYGKTVIEERFKLMIEALENVQTNT